MKTLILILALVSSQLSFASVEGRGVLILAHGVTSHGEHDDHGGGHDHHHPPHAPRPKIDPWEESVREIARNIASRLQEPVELAFGMWNRKNFQAGVDRLVSRGVTELRVVPLFISSHSDVIRAQHYQFHLTETNPLPFDIGRVTLPARMKVSFSTALDDAPELSAILRDRARELCRDASREELILVAHGPTSEEDDQKWLETLRAHGERLGADQPVHVITVRDDAEESDQAEMTRRLRAIVEGITSRGKTACVLPVLMAAGGIEKGILERLQGLEFRYIGKMLAPDPRLADWAARVAVTRDTLPSIRH
jgi:sirohydrochlorin ferrochelatase